MKQIVFALLFMLSAGKVFAGYEISICDSIGKGGACVGKNDVFHFTGDKMKLMALVYNKDLLNTTKIIYKVYLMKNDNDGELYADLTGNIQNGWISTAKKMYFFKPGYYKLDVFKADHSKIGSVFFTLSDR